MINYIKSIQFFISYVFLVPLSIMSVFLFYFNVNFISLEEQSAFLFVWILMTFIFLVSYVEEFSSLFKKRNPE